MNTLGEAHPASIVAVRRERSAMVIQGISFSSVTVFPLRSLVLFAKRILPSNHHTAILLHGLLGHHNAQAVHHIRNTRKAIRST